MEREQKEQEQKAETKEVPNEESNVKEENNESATVETKDNKSIVEQSEMDEGEASTDEPIQYQYVEYKDLMRYEEQYVGQYVSMLVYVYDSIDNNVRIKRAFPAEATQLDGEVYYSCLNYDDLVIYDKRNALDAWVSSDIIEIHAKYLGKKEFISYNTNKTVKIPAFEVYESILLQE